MAISMHSASVPIFAKMLGNMLAWLDKAEAHADARKFDSVNYLQLRLAPDMLPFVKQIQIACDAAKFCAARLAGVEAPKFDDNEASFDDLRARIGKTIDFIQSVPAAQIRRQRVARDRAAVRPRAAEFKGEALPEALRAAQLLLPRDDGVRAAAPQRRRARQGRLSGRR